MGLFQWPPDLKALLPKKPVGNCKNKIGNCAEVDAVNKALKDGANIKNLHMTTIFADNIKGNKLGDYKKACPNCVKTFKGHIKKNYSGWERSK